MTEDKCEYYDNGKCDNFDLVNYNCDDSDNCAWYQLKRLEQENRELKAYKDVNEDFKKAWDELNRKYTEVLKLAKENADSNEYCLQELEKENKELNFKINQLKANSLYNDLTGIELSAKVFELEQENKELSKLIRGTKDYAEVCSVCKDEVTVYPNISGRTDYTQNEVECRTLAQIITRKNNLEQENKEEKKAYNECMHYLACMTEQRNKLKIALEEIREIAEKYKNMEGCRIPLGAIEMQINEVLGDN